MARPTVIPSGVLPRETVLSEPPASRAWTVWGIAAFFYLAAFYLRVSPAVMTSELMRDFGITAAQLGAFSAVYFYAYVLMQVPTGVMVDTWGARRVLITGAVSAAFGTLLFGVAQNYVVASVGRTIVGGATAVAWVITLKLATHWFPPRRFATLSGFGLCIGNIGALFAQVPLRVLVEDFGWRSVALISAAVILAVAGLAWLFVRNDPTEAGRATYAPVELQRRQPLTWRAQVAGLKRLFGYRNVWLIVLAQGGLLGALLSFTGLWGPSFLRVRFDLELRAAAAVCSIMVVSFAVASPIFGMWSDRIGRRKPLYVGGAAVAALGWMVMFFVPGLSLSAFVVVGALTSFAAGAIILGFVFAKESIPVRFLATVSGAVNMGNMIGPTVLQPAIGWMLDRHWNGQMANGLRVYRAEDYEAGFTLIVAWAVLTVALLALTRETYCKQTA